MSDNMICVWNGYTISCNTNVGEIAVYHRDDMEWSTVYRGHGYVLRAIYARICDMAREGSQIDLYRYGWSGSEVVAEFWG